ncbi:MAG: S8 family serine peptidase, partial [Butyrivibrio sp.]|nr:S8 family serine peptidase [Butyrivibrio sp.]
MNQKLENILNLALETSETQRERTGDLNVGFDSETQSWELIVKYHGELSFLETEGIGVEYLIAGYAILTVPENLVDAVSGLEQIEYVEKPKRYYYSMDFGEGLGDPALQSGYGPAESMCFATVTFAPPYLSGEGCLIAILDSGIAWERREFRNADGSTRIQYLWDQTLNSSVAGGNPPQGFRIGVEFDRQQINEALQASESAGGFSVSGAGQGTLLPSIDSGGHGTAVAGIAAGALREASYLGAAPRAGLLIVKLGLPREEGFPRTTEIMRAVTWALQKAQELQQPLVINLSFGNSYGAH